MTIIQRVKKVCKWLIFEEYADNDKKLAELLGYTKSSFSQILNEKVPLSEKFINKLSSIDENVNKVWILEGKGEMFINNHSRLVNEDPSFYKKNKLIPLYEDVQTIGGTSIAANMEPNRHVSEWIDAGDWFPGATAAIRHYGDSMSEYPSGCILALKEVEDRNLIVWGRNYCIETSEYRVTKKLYENEEDYIKAYSTNLETYPDGQTIHPSFKIFKEDIKRIYQVLGCVIKEYSNGPVPVYIDK